MKLLYSLAFLLGADNWKLENIPVEVTETLKEFDKDTSTILDLGCGEGRECIALASDGWHVIGVDFVPLAIRRAKKAAFNAGVMEGTEFYCGDVSKLSVLNLPQIDCAYDIGCFHLLETDQVEGYITGLSDLLKPGGLFLLNAFTPHQQGKRMVGVELETVETLFDMGFKVERTSDKSYWRFPSRWYWLRKQ